MVTKITLEQEKWITSQVHPCPEVFIVAYAGTSFKEWKFVHMCSRLDFFKISDVEAFVRGQFPSAQLVRVFISESSSNAVSLDAPVSPTHSSDTL